MIKNSFIKMVMVAVAFSACTYGMADEPSIDLIKEDKAVVNNEIVDKNSDEVAQRAFELFEKTWEEVSRLYGDDNLNFPAKVVFLNGAPGAGKGTNTLTIMRIMEIPTKPTEVSSLLNTPECEKIKAEGGLVGDDIVLLQVMKELLKPENARGLIIDGFPRSATQAYFIKYLMERLDHLGKGDSTQFRMINFSVSREVSIERQLFRGEEAKKANEIAKEKGEIGERVRPTDQNPEAAALRYENYAKEIKHCLEILHDTLEIDEINSEGTFDEVRAKIYESLQH